MPVPGELREHERLVGRKPKDGIADEYARTNKTDTGDDEEDGTKHAAPRMRHERETEPDSNQDNERSGNDKIRDLGPTERSDRQRTDRVAHPVVLRPSKAFDEEDNDEEGCAKGTKPEQERFHGASLGIAVSYVPLERRESTFG